MAKTSDLSPVSTGSRVRDLRLEKGIKQAALAVSVGISPTYLNLIEHDRRRIGGKVLQKLATALGTDPMALSHGAEGRLVDGLRAILAEHSGIDATSAQTLADRMPDWAEVILAQQTQIKGLQANVDRLSDRLAHDPYLSDALHEVLSTVSSIRSFASILAEPENMDAVMRRRFQDNVYTDALRLADASQNLAQYLDTTVETDANALPPLDEVMACLAEHDFHLPILEKGGLIDEALAAYFPEISDLARPWAVKICERYLSDAGQLPLGGLLGNLSNEPVDPAKIANRCKLPLDLVLRRLSCLPKDLANYGLVICDGAGTIIYKKQVEGFAPPITGTPCALWPLYGALLQPNMPIHRRLEHLGAGALIDTPQFDAYAIATPIGPQVFNCPPRVETTMLIVPSERADAQVISVANTCRLCTASDCPARREPSILLKEF